jgi:hypothetical protein
MAKLSPIKESTLTKKRKLKQRIDPWMAYVNFFLLLALVFYSIYQKSV